MVRFVVLLSAAVLTLAAQEQTGPARDEAVNIDLPNGRLEAVVRLPAQPARPPVVLILASGNEIDSGIAAVLERAGIASMRLKAGTTTDVRGAAAAVAYLRNRSDRFPTVTVFTVAGPDGIVAARAARADALIYPSALVSRVAGVPPPAYSPELPGSAERLNAELKYVLMPAEAIAGRDFEADMIKVTEFVKTVRAFGRRGGPAERSAQARRSPRQIALANIGGVRIGIEWGSPQKRGREVWGSLVKWGTVWMPGADEATTMTTNGPIVLSVPGMASLQVPAGDHTLYTLPGAGRFELIISKDNGQFHTVHAPELELGRIVMQRADRSEAMEGLTFALEPKDPGGVFKLIWDQREYSVQVTTNK
jgi:hypothetical protein